MTSYTTAGPVIEDEEGDTPRSPTPSPPDREAASRQHHSRIDRFLGGAGRYPKAKNIVVACPAMWAAA